MRKLEFVLVIFLLSVFSVSGQRYSKSIELVREQVDYLSDTPDGSTRKVFDLLASSFNQSPSKIDIHCSGTIRIEILNNTETDYLAQVRFHRKKLSGDFNFQGFDADSVLWPDMVGVQIEIMNGRHRRGLLKVNCPTNGEAVNLDITEYATARIGELNIQLTESMFFYNAPQLVGLKNWITLVKSYYSFNLLLNQVYTEQKRNATNSSLDVAKTIIDHLKLNRLLWYYDQQQFTQQLNLKEFDPGKMMVLHERIVRLAKRAATLFDQTVTKTDNFTKEDCLGLCRQYVAMSNYFLLDAQKMQPVDAIAFDYMSRISLHNGELGMLDVLNSTMQSSLALDCNLATCIFDQFVFVSRELLRQDDNALALIQLQNAIIIQKYFRLSYSDLFADVFFESFEGVATAYIKVAHAACKNGNIQLTEQYLNHLYTLLKENQLLFKQMPHQDSVMEKLFYEVVNLALPENTPCSSKLCIQLLNNTNALVSEFGKEWLPYYLQAYQKNCLLNLLPQIDSLGMLLEIKQYPDASDLVSRIGVYYQKYSKYLPSSQPALSQHIYALYLVYLKQSKQLVLAGQPEVALEQMLLAREMSGWLPMETQNEITSQIKIVAFQLVKENIERANFQTWAMRLDASSTNINHADSIELKYLNGRIPEALLLIRQARVKLESRNCQALQQKLDNSLVEINTALHNKAFLAVKNTYASVLTVVENKSGCTLDLLEFEKIKHACQPILIYLNELDKVKALLYEKGYQSVIGKYVALQSYIQVNDLGARGIQLPSLFTFVGEQNQSALTLMTAQYYVDHYQYREAFEYLLLAYDQKTSRRDARSAMQNIAAGLAKEDKEGSLSIEEALDAYTKGDPWFAYFKFVYRKNRLL